MEVLVEVFLWSFIRGFLWSSARVHTHIKQVRDVRLSIFGVDFSVSLRIILFHVLFIVGWTITICEFVMRKYFAVSTFVNSFPCVSI